MKILMINNAYQQYGSTEAVVRSEKALLEAEGHEVVLYERDSKELSQFSLGERLALPINTIYSARTERDIRGLVRTLSPDVAYVHNFLPLISPSVYHALDSLGVPSVQAVHEFRLLCPNSHFYTRGQVCERCKYGNYLHAVRFACYKNSRLISLMCAATLGINRLAGFLRKISAFICLTEFSKRKFMEVGIPEQKLFVRPHSIDVSGIKPNFGLGSYILFLGRLSEEKGLFTLIRAIGGLKEVMLKIAGAGPIEADLRRFVAENRLTNVEFVGVTSGENKWDLLRNSLFVILPSECYETFGMVVVEGYAAGKPVIAPNFGSLPYVIENGRSGLLFNPGSVADLREKALRLLASPNEIESMGRYGRELVETKYHPEQNYKSLMNIFSSVVSRSGEPLQRG